LHTSGGPTMSDRKETNASKETIHVALSVYDPDGTYSRHAGVVMTSMFERTQSHVCVHILHDDTLTDNNRLKFSRTADKFGQEIRFIDVTDSFSKLNVNGVMDKNSGFFTRGAFFRLFMPDLLDVGKVIYMDCDIAVNTDILNLWNAGLSLSDFSLAAVRESFYGGKVHKNFFDKTRFGVLKIEFEKYFNSGVLVINLNQIRQKHNLLDEARAFYERYSFWVKLPDQDFLNVVFKDDVFFIDERFNRFFATSPKELSDDIEEAIAHFAGDVKPWLSPKNSPKNRFYWETFARSEWNDQLFDAISNLSIHHSISDCIKHIENKLLKKFHRLFTVYLPRQFICCRMYLLERRHAAAAHAAHKKRGV
jgi:lipopolysaccharide biosynthesis glycosyltransferase